MACRTLEEAIKEEIKRYVKVCADIRRGCQCSRCRPKNVRLAHIRYHAIRKLRNYA